MRTYKAILLKFLLLLLVLVLAWANTVDAAVTTSVRAHRCATWTVQTTPCVLHGPPVTYDGVHMPTCTYHCPHPNPW